MASKVYYTSFHCKNGDSRLDKLKRLIEKAGISTIDFEDKYAVIKIHFGEPGNLAYLRPNYAKVVADEIKALGGRVFLSDCNTLYPGGRKNALEHLDSAYVNGYNPFTTGCQIIIGDGLKGTDDVSIPVEGGVYVKEAKIGRAIMDADIVISLNHFKGHELTGFGGAIKNLGMGCGSRGGKMEMHSAGKPEVNQDLCVGCGLCMKECAHGGITVTNHKASIDHNKCVGCGRCIGACPKNATHAGEDEAFDITNCKIAEYAKAVVEGRPCFHISLVMEVSPNCDCHGENDIALVPDVGMFASFDPVALDVACADAVNRQPIQIGSVIDDGKQDSDHFNHSHPETNWRSGMEHAQKLGIGQMEYELIEVK